MGDYSPIVSSMWTAVAAHCRVTRTLPMLYVLDKLANRNAHFVHADVSWSRLKYFDLKKQFEGFLTFENCLECAIVSILLLWSLYHSNLRFWHLSITHCSKLGHGKENGQEMYTCYAAPFFQRLARHVGCRSQISTQDFGCSSVRSRLMELPSYRRLSKEPTRMRQASRNGRENSSDSSHCCRLYCITVPPTCMYHQTIRCFSPCESAGVVNSQEHYSIRSG